eukprot:tig00000169_g11893.t1
MERIHAALEAHAPWNLLETQKDEGASIKGEQFESPQLAPARAPAPFDTELLSFAAAATPAPSNTVAPSNAQTVSLDYSLAVQLQEAADLVMKWPARVSALQEALEAKENEIQRLRGELAARAATTDAFQQLENELQALRIDNKARHKTQELMRMRNAEAEARALHRAPPGAAATHGEESIHEKVRGHVSPRAARPASCPTPSAPPQLRRAEGHGGGRAARGRQAREMEGKAKQAVLHAQKESSRVEELRDKLAALQAPAPPRPLHPPSRAPTRRLQVRHSKLEEEMTELRRQPAAPPAQASGALEFAAAAAQEELGALRAALEAANAKAAREAGARERAEGRAAELEAAAREAMAEYEALLGRQGQGQGQGGQGGAGGQGAPSCPAPPDCVSILEVDY